jgi:hypothetical protein
VGEKAEVFYPLGLANLQNWATQGAVRFANAKNLVRFGGEKIDHYW